MNYLQLITPINLDQESKKFFTQPDYHPQFEYAWNSAQVEQFIHDRPKYASLAQAILTQDTEEITQTAKTTFDTDIEPAFLTEAEEIVAQLPSHSYQATPETLATRFKQVFDYFAINYTVELSDRHGFNIRPNHKARKMVISLHLNFQFFTIESEVRHELIHVIRSVNGKALNIPVSDDYLPTEEGLASYFMDFAGADGQLSLFQHAAEYAATQISLKGSLRQVVEYLISLGFNPALAWQRGARHKYGFVDTSLPGDIMKPAMYFHHELKVKQLTDSDRLRLLLGKFSLTDLDKYPVYQGIIAEDKIREFYQ